LNEKGEFADTSSVWKQRLLGVKSVSLVADVVLDELEDVHVLLAHEIKRLRIQLSSDRYCNKRLLFMFQRDLMPGISGQILESKDSRDTQSVPTPIRMRWKYVGWSYLILQNIGMLFYVMLFALYQTQQRQNAWVRSFGIWLGMEVVVISTVTVLLMNLLLPAMLMKDVQSVREKLTQSIVQYHQRLHRQDRKKEYAHDADASDSEEDEGKNEEQDKEKAFNAAEYLFVSYRMAKEFSKLTIAKIILQYQSPWPRRSYHYATNNTKRDYDGRLNALYRSMGLLLIFVLTNLLNVPVNVQDMIIKSLTTVVFGYLMYVQTQLYAISPALVFIPYLILFLVGVAITVLMIRWFGCGNVNSLLPLKEKIAASIHHQPVKLAVRKEAMHVCAESVGQHTEAAPALISSAPSGHMQPIVEPLDGNKKHHITRRQSVQMGVQLLKQANQQVKQEQLPLLQVDNTIVEVVENALSSSSQSTSSAVSRQDNNEKPTSCSHEGHNENEDGAAMIWMI
jgi:hypothetical protein